MSTSIQATPSAVLAYCEAGHTNAQAAAQFSIHERTVRKWKARVQGATEVNRDQLAPTRAISVARIESMSVSLSDTTIDVHIPDEWIAHDGQLWRCGRCGELMPPLPGTTGASWNTHGCYLHQVAPIVIEEQADPLLEQKAAPASEPAIAPDPALQEAVLNLERPGPASLLVMVEPARSVDYWGISAAFWLISWGNDHPAEVKLALGLLITWLVILVAF